MIVSHDASVRSVIAKGSDVALLFRLFMLPLYWNDRRSYIRFNDQQYSRIYFRYKIGKTSADRPLRELPSVGSRIPIAPCKAAQN